MARYSLGIDIGGTFTDIVIWDHDGGRSWSRKVLTTHDDPARAAQPQARAGVDGDGAGPCIFDPVIAGNPQSEASGDHAPVRRLVAKTAAAGAIDIAPYLVWQLYGPDKLQWDASAQVWQTIGALGEKLGLRWGGRWKQRDMGHFELVVQQTTEV